MRDMVEQAQQFVAAGGVLLWSDWKQMTPEERAAFVAVQNRRRVEQAMRIGNASSGPRGVLETAAELDGGQALESALMRKAVTDAAIR